MCVDVGWVGAVDEEMVDLMRKDWRIRQELSRLESSSWSERVGLAKQSNRQVEQRATLIQAR